MRSKPLSIGIGLALVAVSATGVLAAGPASGTVFSGRGSNVIAQVVWGMSDPVTGEGRIGGLYGDIETFGTLVGLWEKDDHAITCDAGTPGDPSDDYSAMAGTGRSGDGPGTVSVAADLRSAVVTGVLTIESYAFDQCAGTWTVTATETGVPMRLDLVATGRPSSDASSFHDLVPGVSNSIQVTSGISRSATGTASLGGLSLAFDAGLISRNRWTYHEISHS
jgi:hypothetical protein